MVPGPGDGRPPPASCAGSVPVGWTGMALDSIATPSRCSLPARLGCAAPRPRPGGQHAARHHPDPFPGLDPVAPDPPASGPASRHPPSRRAGAHQLQDDRGRRGPRARDPFVTGPADAARRGSGQVLRRPDGPPRAPALRRRRGLPQARVAPPQRMESSRHGRSSPSGDCGLGGQCPARPRSSSRSSPPYSAPPGRRRRRAARSVPGCRCAARAIALGRVRSSRGRGDGVWLPRRGEPRGSTDGDCGKRCRLSGPRGWRARVDLRGPVPRRRL